MRPWRTYWTCVGVQWGSALLVQNPGAPDGTPERSFVRACTILLNHRRSTKVLFSNIYARYITHLSGGGRRRNWCFRRSLLSILPIFYERFLYQNSFAKKLRSQTVSRKKLWTHFSAKKLLVKCWWNWHLGQRWSSRGSLPPRARTFEGPGVDFTNTFMHSFHTCRSQKRKKTYSFFCTFGIFSGKSFS